MDKVEALEEIRIIWENNDLNLYHKIKGISEHFYSAGLNLVATATYIKATPSELDALLSMAGLEDDVIKKISDINPPKTTWTMLVNANEEELKEALNVLENKKDAQMMSSELVYKSMIDISGPTIEQGLSELTGSEVKKIRVKAEQYQKLNAKEIGFLKTVAARRYDLSDKQLAWFRSIVEKLIKEDVISKNSLDGDQDFCDKILKIFGK